MHIAGEDGEIDPKALDEVEDFFFLNRFCVRSYREIEEGDLIAGRNLFKIAVIGDDGRDFDWKNFCFHPMEKVVEAMAFFGDEEKKPRFGLDRVVIPAQPKFLRDWCKTFRKVIPFKNIAVIFKQAAHKKAAGFQVAVLE